MIETRECRACKTLLTLNKDNFGHTPSGGFRRQCRRCIANNVAKHSAQNPDMVNSRLNRRKSQEHATGDLLPSEKIKIIKQKRNQQGNLCYYCKDTLNMLAEELDHLHPISKGGSNSSDNLVLACFQCNREKHNKTVEEYKVWMKKNGYQPRF